MVGKGRIKGNLVLLLLLDASGYIIGGGGVRALIYLCVMRGGQGIGEYCASACAVLQELKVPILSICMYCSQGFAW